MSLGVCGHWIKLEVSGKTSRKFLFLALPPTKFQMGLQNMSGLGWLGELRLVEQRCRHQPSWTHLHLPIREQISHHYSTCWPPLLPHPLACPWKES